jgi:menaquinone-dependent protoporphyrinogen oxidase
MARLLILYASREGQTARIVERMAVIALGRGHEVEVDRCPRFSVPPSPDPFAGVLVGGSIHLGRHERSLERFVIAHHDVLERLPAGFFSVSLSAASPRAEVRAAAQGYLDDFLQETGWHPQATAIFAGALAYTRYGPLKRWIMRRIVAREGGDTDTSRDHEYTDWEAVERYTATFLAPLERGPE